MNYFSGDTTKDRRGNASFRAKGDNSIGGAAQLRGLNCTECLEPLGMVKENGAQSSVVWLVIFDDLSTIVPS